MSFSQDMLQMVPAALLVAVIAICLTLAWFMIARKPSAADAQPPAGPQPRSEPASASKSATVTIDTRDRVRSFISELDALER